MSPVADTSGSHPLVVGITGASGSIVGIELLKALGRLGVRTHLVVTPWGLRTVEHETGLSREDLKALATVTHRPGDMGAAISSGSFLTAGMVIAPCSMKTVGAVAGGYGGDLVARAADVVLKERRRLVVVPREAPLHAVHLRNLLTLSELGATIFPLTPGFYSRPGSISDLVGDMVVRIIDQLGIHSTSQNRWTGLDAGR